MNSCGLSADDFEKVRARAEVKEVKAGACVFSEGDSAECVYFIESGKVSIYLKKFNAKDEIHALGAGDCFGEMAVLLNEKRNASADALEDTRFLTLTKTAFLDLVRNDREIAEKIGGLLADRNEELILRETLISSTGIDSANLHVSIKGDPSLRETALFRERYQSFVDMVLPQLTPRLEDLLLRRCVYQIFIGFNSGEIRTSSLLNPFADEIHQVGKLLDPAYIDRHFPPIPYAQKTGLIGKLYRGLRAESWFRTLPPHLQRIWGDSYENWQAVAPEQISSIVASLATLREIQNFYIRNVTLSVVRDAVHMQFNCDGTHIVSAERYARFLEDNL